jgi:hypothetical protein
MRTKLTLNLDQLTVDSFDTSAATQEKGTVFGEQCTCYTNCTCPGCPTCDHTACGQNTCQASCNGTCAGQDSCDCGTNWHTCAGYTCDGGWNCGYTALQTNCDQICY